MAHRKNPPGQTATAIDLNAILASQAAEREARGRRAVRARVAREEAHQEALRQASKRRHAERRHAAAGGDGGGQVAPKKGGP
jgi:hypothetical protein